MRVEKFTCIACDGTGGSGPLRIMTGRPFRPCIQCDGLGELTRYIGEDEDVVEWINRTTLPQR